MIARRLLIALGFAAVTAAPAFAPAFAHDTPPSSSPPPPPPPVEIAPFVGEYGPPGGQLIVYEAGGRLHARGAGLPDQRLERAAEGRWRAGATVLRFGPADRGAVRCVSVGVRTLARRDLGAEAEARIRAGVRADAARLKAAALAADPPREATPARASDLVPVNRFDPTIRLDVRYATADNFIGLRVYDRAEAYLQRPAAEALARVSRSLKARGYGLMVWDAYRPWHVTRMFWDATPPGSRAFVADPSRGSRHNRGAAVDLTLYDLTTGKPVDMPSGYDDFSERAHPEWRGGAARQRWFRDLLRREMEKEGFTVYDNEWWHFDHRDWRLYGLGDDTFEALSRRP